MQPLSSLPFLCHFVKELFISIFRVGQNLPGGTTIEPPKRKIVSNIDHTKQTNYVPSCKYLLFTRSTLYFLPLEDCITSSLKFWKKCACHQKVQIFYQNVNLKNLESELSYKISTIASITRQQRERTLIIENNSSFWYLSQRNIYSFAIITYLRPC